MNENIISFNVPNFLTIGIMSVLFFALLGLVVGVGSQVLGGGGSE